MYFISLIYNFGWIFHRNVLNYVGIWFYIMRTSTPSI